MKIKNAVLVLVVLIAITGSADAATTKKSEWKDYLYRRSFEYGISYVETLRLEIIAECESTWRQYGDDGKVIKNFQGYPDYGIFQVHKPVWGEELSDELGIDDVASSTPEQNIEAGLYIYQKNGFDPWNPSLPCQARKLQQHYRSLLVALVRLSQ